MADKNLQIPENAVILCSEPLKGWTVDEMRMWISQHTEESDLATATALVDMKAGWLMHLTDDEGGEIYSEEEHKWCELSNELYAKILSIMEKENETGIANHDLTKVGLFYRIEPFMHRNGYRDGAGWWVKEKQGSSTIFSI